MALVEQQLRIFLVDSGTLTLPVRAMGPALVRTFVPVELQPLQRGHNVIFRLAGTAHLIGIFYAQYEFTSMLAGEAKIEQRNVGRAYMGIAGGRWRNTGTNLGHDIQLQVKKGGLYG